MPFTGSRFERMLHCNMNTSAHTLALSLEDILAEVRHARQAGDVGRLALLTFCDLRRWARLAKRGALAEHANAIFLRTPYADRDSFLEDVDALVNEAKGDLAALRLHDEGLKEVPSAQAAPERSGSGRAIAPHT